MLTRNAEDENEVEKIRVNIWKPPHGEIGEGPWSAESQMESFNTLRTQLGV